MLLERMLMLMVRVVVVMVVISRQVLRRCARVAILICEGS